MNRLTVSILTVVLLTLSILSSSDANQKSNIQCIWKIENLQASYVDSFRDSMSNLRTYKNGKLLAIKGSYTNNNCGDHAIELDKIRLKGKKLGLLDITAVGIYENLVVPETLVEGRKNVSIKYQDPGSSEYVDLGGYSVSREQKGGPAFLSILKNPTELTIVFLIPKNFDEAFELIFGEVVQSITVNQNQENKSLPE